MKKDNFTVAEAIKAAIDLERNGRKFYLDAEQKTEHDSGKKMFRMLADEEALHLATFERMLDASGSFPNWRELVKGYPAARQVPAFGRRGSPKRIAVANASDLEALRMAMHQENSAIAFYEKVAPQAGDEGTKAVFDFVRQQEVFHYNLLQAEYDNLTNTGFWFDSAEFRMDGKV